MCLCPLPIKSNKLDFQQSRDSFINYVPCGTCYECRKLYADGYVARLLAHYNKFHSKGLPVFYFTLTYDNVHLPHYKSLICHNKKDYQLFFKRLRKFISFDYFLVSEYGDSKKRPHAHLVVFLHNFISTKEFHKFVKRAWQNGNVFFSFNNGLVVDIRPFYYCTKYLTKSSSDFYHINKIKDFDMLDFVNNAKEQGYSFLSFHLQSKGLGKSLLNNLSDRDFINGKFTFPLQDSKIVSLPIPLYIYRLKCYKSYLNVNGNISYELNDYGRLILRKKIIRQYRLNLENYNFYLDFIKPSYNSLRSVHSLFKEEHCDEVATRIKSLLPDFIAWKLIYRSFDTINFTFKSFSDDLDIFIKSADNMDFLFDKVNHYYHPHHQDFILIDRMFNQIINNLKYKAYVENQKRKCSSQLIRSLRTGKIKSVIIEDFKTYKNLNNLCLTIFKNLKNPKNKKVSDVVYASSVLLQAV